MKKLKLFECYVGNGWDINLVSQIFKGWIK